VATNGPWDPGAVGCETASVYNGHNGADGSVFLFFSGVGNGGDTVSCFGLRASRTGGLLTPKEQKGGGITCKAVYP
jgi:hypothetical protein